MKINNQRINIIYYNNLLFTIIIWSTSIDKTMSTKNLPDITSIRQATTKLTINSNKSEENLTKFNTRENEHGSKRNYPQYLLSSTRKDDNNNDTKISKLKNVKRQRSFQYPSGFMLTENSNTDYTNQNPMAPKYVQPSMPTSPTSSVGQTPRTNYMMYGMNDNTPSDDKEYESYIAPDEYYHHHHHPHEYHPPPMPPVMMAPTKSNFFSPATLKILLIVLLKLLLIKLSIIGFIKLMLLILLKLPIIFIGILFKLLFFVKITNFFKILTIPILLPLLLLILSPLLLPLLAPLLLLPLLLPLLLFLPIPVLTLSTTTTTTTTAAPGKRRKRRYLDGSGSYRHSTGVSDTLSKSDGDLEFFRHLIESERCFERIACKLASDRNATPFAGYISRFLEKVKDYLYNPRLDSYVRAYRVGASNGSNFSTCVKYYPCSKFKT